jgi:hypothetical protein
MLATLVRGHSHEQALCNNTYEWYIDKPSHTVDFGLLASRSRWSLDKALMSHLVSAFKDTIQAIATTRCQAWSFDGNLRIPYMYLYSLSTLVCRVDFYRYSKAPQQSGSCRWCIPDGSVLHTSRWVVGLLEGVRN